MASLDALPDLLELFPPSALASLVGLLETVSSMKARKSLCTGLARLGEKDIQALTEGLPRHPWYVTRNIAYTLGLIGGEAVLPYLGGLTTHDDVRVRKEALRTLNKIGGPPASDWIFRGLFHADAETRMQAIRSLPKDPNPGYAAHILELVASAGFDQRPLGERQAFYRLLGSLSSDSILPRLKESLAPRRWFASRAQKESRLLAAAALSARNTPAARKLLRQALPGAGPEAREVINECLSRPVRPGTEERWE
jgi:HEAT repeat protein